MSTSPRSAHQLIVGAASLYWRYPLIFPVLAAAVVVPYQVAVFALTGSGPLTRSSLSVGVLSLLALIEWVLMGPLVSALHVHAVSEARAGHRPRLVPVARRGLRTLPVVVAASIISGLGHSCRSVGSRHPRHHLDVALGRCRPIGSDRA